MESTDNIRIHYEAVSQAICVTGKDEHRCIKSGYHELDPETTEVAYVSANGSGPVISYREDEKGVEIRKPEENGGLSAGYRWATKRSGRVLFVTDFHTLVNNPGQWRTLIDMRPLLKGAPAWCAKCDKNIEPPKVAKDGENDNHQAASSKDATVCPKCGSIPVSNGSLVVFIGPIWNFDIVNPLRGSVPIIEFSPPNRSQVRAILDALHPLNGDADACVSAVDGLSAEAIDQVGAECLIRSKAKNNGRLVWDPAMLRSRKCDELRREGLEIWDPVTEIGGMSGIKNFLKEEAAKWMRDPQISVRRFLNAGVFGSGKSLTACYYGNEIGAIIGCCEIPKLKTGIVGGSEGNLARVLNVVDAMARYSPVVLVLDEIDTIAREGLDGGTSSGMFQMLLTWLQQSKSLVTVWATLNRLDKLDAALMSRFQAQFFYDLGSEEERRAVAEIHYRRLGCSNPEESAIQTAELTDGFSSREIAEAVCSSVARLTSRKPNEATIARVCKSIVPASITQAEQLKLMRQAAQGLRLANDPKEGSGSKSRQGRRVAV